ncbi:MAG: ATPase, T2SS/T4P/T4SS family [Candidatus Omnitrophota bacterium]|nr:ATPase, T2SS/T4P/T4SS family [Candidatus Omnitrophota bacterium]MDZ4241362.1 ATPase, T2SS/T4P/T4SS family [Candidatus Omnitrophota bacterium]
MAMRNECLVLKNLNVPPETTALLPPKFAVFYQVVPLEETDGVLKVAAAAPEDISMLDAVALATGKRVKAVLAEGKDVREAIRKYYGIGAETIESMRDAGFGTWERDIQPVDDGPVDPEASIAKWVHQIFAEAHAARATDVHIEPYENALKIRYRIDGMLYDIKLPDHVRHFKDAVNSRIKIMAGLNIAEKRLPQDGRLKINAGGAELDLRVSFLPAQFGESVVIRILNSRQLYDLSRLGLDSGDLDRLDVLLKNPHGIIFLTGPTGSGKTTTLYSCLSAVNSRDKKIITIEDPVEYRLNGVTQVQVNPGIGLTFAAGLRSMLRHDPDIMMVGEVRDLETARIAVQVALTGHLVFSTLHTNDAAGGIARLTDMGIEPYLVASAVRCFVAQRLVRVLCPLCKKPAELDKEAVRAFGACPVPSGNLRIYEARGCESCGMTGYHGREGVYEFLTVDDPVRQMIMSSAPATQIKEKAVARGTRTLLQHGWKKILEGRTTPAEVLRVTAEG